MLSGLFIDRPGLRSSSRSSSRWPAWWRCCRFPSRISQYRAAEIAVTASYAGASAEVVEATVAQPIEARVVGVDNMLYMKSTSGSDGSYTLTVTFAVGTDPDFNTVKVQNRVGLAEAQLPAEVRSQGHQRHQEILACCRSLR